MWKVTQTPVDQQLKCRKHERYAYHNVRGFLLRYFHELTHKKTRSLSNWMKKLLLVNLFYRPTQHGPTICIWLTDHSQESCRRQGTGYELVRGAWGKPQEHHYQPAGNKMWHAADKWLLQNGERRTAGMEEALFDLRVAIMCLLNNMKAKSTVSKKMELSEVACRLLEVSVPTFDRKVLSWKNCWEKLTPPIHCKTGLNDTKKLMYLQDALKDGPAKFVIQKLTRTFKRYEETIKCAKERCDCQVLHQKAHILGIVNVVHIKNGSNKELYHLLWCCFTASMYSFETLVTQSGQKLDEKTRLKWAEFSKKSKNAPQCTEFHYFLNFLSRHFKSVSYTGHKKASKSDQLLPVEQCA